MNGKMKKIYVCAIPCEKRFLDARRVVNYFCRNGYKVVYRPKNADVIVFFTCVVINRAVEESLNKIKKFQKYKGELVVAGCLPGVKQGKLAKIFDGKTISTKTLDEIDKLFPEHKVKFNEIPDQNIVWAETGEIELANIARRILGKLKPVEKIYGKFKNIMLKNLLKHNPDIYRNLTKRPFDIRISWGCVGNCSYCAIKKAVGPLRSKPIDECMREFRNGLNEGYTDFVIKADNAGAYGVDKESSIVELLDEMTKTPGDYQIAIQAFDPRWLVKYIDQLEEILRRDKISDIDIPIQSGCSRIIELMHRYSDTEKIKEAFIKLKRWSPEISTSTHCIVGFPTETKEEFKQSLYFIKECNINSVIVLGFSCMIGTEAAKIEPKVSEKEISQRMEYIKKFMKQAGYRCVYISKWNVLKFNKIRKNS